MLKIHQISKDDLTIEKSLNIEAIGMPSNVNGMTISHYACSMKRTEVTIPFVIEGVEEFIPYVYDTDFYMVIRKKVNLDAIGPNEETIEEIGEDVGKYDYKKKAPPSSPDLPPGFIEFYNGNT